MMTDLDELLQFPFLWPGRWVLPVVRRAGGDLGLVTHDRGVPRPVVYYGNLYEVSSPDDLKGLPARRYESLEELNREWRVD